MCGQHHGCPIRLQFDCPACGPPYRIDIPIILNGAKAVDARSPDMPMWIVTTPGLSWEGITITPSINNTPGGHGRKKPCLWHGSIINGEVRP